MKTTERYTPEQSEGFRKLRGPNKATTVLMRTLFSHIDATDHLVKGIAKDAGVHRQQLSNYRAGKFTPRLDIFEAIANAAGYDVVLVKRHCGHNSDVV